jgi:UDP-N-acetyl-L-fucosamine synthase
MLNTVAETYEIPLIFSTHPRTRKRIIETGINFHPMIHQIKPLGFHDYVYLQMNATATLSDSGIINEESSILNFPALNIREAHEVQKEWNRGLL